MIYRVTVKNNNKKIKAVVASGASMAKKLGDLTDVDLTGAKDNYILMYDAATKKYKAVNPDEVLSSAVSDTESPGLPSNFKNQLDIDLDDKIDLDAGNF